MNTPTNPVIRATLASLIAVGLGAASTMALAAKGDTEKCAGIVKAGKNDCGTSKSACAGTTTADRDVEAWILVPTGTCERIAGGHVTDKPENVHGGAAAAESGGNGSPPLLRDAGVPAVVR